MRISDILKAAKARLTPETWGQGNGQPYINEAMLGDKQCAAMVLRGNEPYLFGIRYRAAELLCLVATGRGSGEALIAWNDAPGRTLQDVHDAYDAAIAIAEAQEAAALAETPAPETAR